ncbi:MAG: tetratricopeptide repeat protein [Acidobacteriota bacterium]
MLLRRNLHKAPLALVLLLAGCASAPPATRSGATPAIDPNDPLAPTILMIDGQGLVAQGKIQDGLLRYLKALELQPTNPIIHNLVGLAEMQRGDLAKALTSFSRALEIMPNYADARNNRGVAYVQIGQNALAEADFLTVLGDLTYANRTGAYFNLGTLYLARGSLTAAEENLRKAATPAGPIEAHIYLAELEERLGRTEQAETAYQAAMARAPERLDVPLKLARLLATQGRYDEARALLVRIAEMNPDSPEAAQARELLGR